jgi:fructose transport system substrate-binding protein
MEQLLAKNKKINVVYTINEPTAIGACAAAAAAGIKLDVMVSVDGGGAGINAVKSGCINATSQQYPLLMADLGVQAIYDIVKNGTKPTTSEGLDFFNTGVKLITDDPQEGVPSETTEYGLANAWG